MPNELHIAVAEGDLETIMDLSKTPNFDVNCLHTEYQTRAIDWAAQQGHLEVLKYLIETLGADISGKVPGKRSLLYWGLKGGSTEVCDYIQSKLPSPYVYKINEIVVLMERLEKSEHVGSQYFPALKEAIINDEDINCIVREGRTLASLAFCPNLCARGEDDWTEVFKLLLQHNADLKLGDRPPREESLKYIDERRLRYLLIEMLIQADTNAYLKAYRALKATPTVEEIIDLLGNRKLKKSRLDQIKMMLEQLVIDGLLPNSLSFEIYKQLESKTDFFIDPSDYPTCLKEFIAKQQNELKMTVEEIVLQLQYARQLIPSTYTEAQLQFHKDLSVTEAINHRNNYPEHYKLDNLNKFVDSKNHLKSMMEMRMYPEIVTSLCMVVMHPDLPEQTKTQCLFLLKHMETPTDIEDAMLSVGDNNFASAQIIVNHVDKLNEKVSGLETKVNFLTDQFQQTNTKLDLVLSFLREKKFEKDLKRKALDSTDEGNQKKPCFFMNP